MKNIGIRAKKRLSALLLSVIMAGSLCINTTVQAQDGSTNGNSNTGTTTDGTTGEGSGENVELKNPRIVPDSSLTAGQKVTWDCVEFGSYPQAEVVPSAEDYTEIGEDILGENDLIVDEDLYNQLESESGWDSNGDLTVGRSKYRRMKKEDATQATFGSSYDYNWSDSDTYHYFKYEPIKWRVLKTEGSKAFLLSDIALDDQKYNTEDEDVTWETSTIRSWLNGYRASSNQQRIDYSSKNFIGSAFTSDEKSAIADTDVVNADNIYFGTEGGNGTTDKVFLLSESEVYGVSAEDYGFASSLGIDEARRSKSSVYAKAMGVYIDPDDTYQGNCHWWLRSPGYSSAHAADVISHGGVYGDGSSVILSNCGVRAALNLNLSSDQWSYAGTVSVSRTVDESGDNSQDSGSSGESTDSGSNNTSGNTNTNTTSNTTPKKGTKLTDSKTKAVYIVTKAGSAAAYAGTTNKNATSVATPATVKIGNITYKVTSVYSNAFKNNKRLKKATISGNVTSIGSGAFQGCTALTTVKTGNKVTTIGSKAFYGCKKLSSLTLGKKVAGIGNSAFVNCTSIKKITLPAAVTKIGSNAFKNCSKLTTLTIQSKKLSAKKIGGNAFTKAGKSNYKKLIVKVPSGKYTSYKKVLKQKGLSAKAKVKKN